tara:strand:+ start:2571 stop:2885 length:315 start_codon:yes stop_codon:yes gene_type:complete
VLGCISGIIEKKKNGINLTSDILNIEIDFLSKSLELMRDAQQISNDAYLDSGSIQGGLTVISSLIKQNISDTEIESLLYTLHSRALILDEKYPGLDSIIETYRE